MLFKGFCKIQFRFLTKVCFWSCFWADLDMFGLAWSWHTLSSDAVDLPSLPTCPCWRPAARGGSAGWVRIKPGWNPGRGARHAPAPETPPWPGCGPGHPPCTPTGPDRSQCSPQRRSGHGDWNLSGGKWPPGYGTTPCNLKGGGFTREILLHLEWTQAKLEENAAHA